MRPQGRRSYATLLLLNMINLIGLGPADAGAMSVAARDALRAAPRLFIRTARHPAAQEIAAEGIAFETFDSLYQTLDTFDQVYDAIVTRLLTEAQSSDIAYAVPGHPLVAEETVRRLMIRARERSVPFRVVGSSSFLEPALTALGVSLSDGLLLADALSDVPINSEIPLLFYQVYDRETASRVKLLLLEEYPDDWEVRVARGTGNPDTEIVEAAPLSRLDRVAVDHLTVVYVPALPAELRKKRLEDLVRVMARLRGPGGCPWDIEQDHHTLKRYMIEECYEAIEAIENDDLDALCEELGDVLLQVVFHAQLEAETGCFDISDVVTKIVDKLIRRHPHVFGDLSVADADEVLRNWEQIKRNEKGEGWRESVLDGVPKGLPALMLALEISKRAVKVGFEWEKLEDVFAKLDEELAELREAVQHKDQSEVASEIGDLLFTLVNVARWQKVDPEEALREMVQRFSMRFRYVEEAARRDGRALQTMSLAEMDALWEEAKAAM